MSFLYKYFIIILLFFIIQKSSRDLLGLHQSNCTLILQQLYMFISKNQLDIIIRNFILKA